MRIVRLLIIGLSALVGGAAVGLLFLIAGTPRTLLGWAWGVLAFGLGFLITRTTLSMGMNTSAAFEQGISEAASESRGATFEATGRKAGAIVGKGLNTVARIGVPKPTAPPTSPAASTSDEGTAASSAPSDTGAAPKPEVTVDRAARVIGSMIGRRTAERRNRP